MIDSSKYIKFLDPYEKKDKAIFFGREDEVEQLFIKVKKKIRFLKLCLFLFFVMVSLL